MKPTTPALLVAWCILFAGVQSVAFGQAPALAAAVDTAVAQCLRTDPLMMPYYTGTIVPGPQQAAYADAFVSMTQVAIIVGADVENPDPLVAVLQDRITRYGGASVVCETPATNATVVVSIGDTAYARRSKNIPDVPKKKQAYVLATATTGDLPLIILNGHDRLGTLWAIASVIQLIHWRDGQTMMRAATVVDYPAMPHRGLIFAGTQGYFFRRNTGRDGPYERLPNAEISQRFLLHRQFLLLAKCNEPVYQNLTRADCYRYYWKQPDNMPEDAHIQDDVDWFARTFRPLGIRWWGVLRPHAAGNSSPEELSRKLSADQESLQGLIYFARLMEKAGGHLSIVLDDIRFPITPYDKEHLGSAREVDTWLITRVMAAIKKEYPRARLLVAPPFYWGPNGRGWRSYPEDRDAYLFKIGREWPAEVEVFWSGDRVNSQTTATTAHVDWITERIRRKPYKWVNCLGFAWHYARRYYPTDSVNFGETCWDGWEDRIGWYGFNSTFPNLYIGNLVSLDFQWNVRGYLAGKEAEVERARRESIEKMVGSGAYPVVRNLTRPLIYFDQYLQPLWRNEEETLRRRQRAARRYEELEAKRDAVFMALDELKNKYPAGLETWTELERFSQAALLVDSVKQDSTLKIHLLASLQRKAATAAKEFDATRDIFISTSHFVNGNVCPHTIDNYVANEIDDVKTFGLHLSGIPSTPPAVAIFEANAKHTTTQYALHVKARKARPSQCTILVNDKMVRDGPNPFAAERSSLLVCDLPVGILVAGLSNRLEIRSLITEGPGGLDAVDEEGRENIPALIVEYAVLRAVETME